MNEARNVRGEEEEEEEKEWGRMIRNTRRSVSATARDTAQLRRDVYWRHAIIPRYVFCRRRPRGRRDDACVAADSDSVAGVRKHENNLGFCFHEATLEENLRHTNTTTKVSSLFIE